MNDVTVGKAESRIARILGSGDHDTLRDLMIRARAEWKGRCRLEADPDATRDYRILLRAYTQVYEVKFTDDNDNVAGPLTPFETAHLPKVWSEIRKIHGLPHPAKTWWTMHPWAWVKVMALLALFMIAFGAASPFVFAWKISTFIVANFHYIAAVLFVIGVAVWLVKAGHFDWLWKAVNQPAVIPPVPETPQTYTRKTGQVYGDARPADDWEIDEALRDHTGGFNQMFKE